MEFFTRVIDASPEIAGHIAITLIFIRYLERRDARVEAVLTDNHKILARVERVLDTR